MNRKVKQLIVTEKMINKDVFPYWTAEGQQYLPLKTKKLKLDGHINDIMPSFITIIDLKRDLWNSEKLYRDFVYGAEDCFTSIFPLVKNIQ